MLLHQWFMLRNQMEQTHQRDAGKVDQHQGRNLAGRERLGSHWVVLVLAQTLGPVWPGSAAGCGLLKTDW